MSKRSDKPVGIGHNSKSGLEKLFADAKGEIPNYHELMDKLLEHPEHFIEKYGGGATAIALTYNASRAPVVASRKRTVNPLVSKDEEAHILKLREEGLSHKDIAERVRRESNKYGKIDPKTVGAVLRRNGIHGRATKKA